MLHIIWFAVLNTLVKKANTNMYTSMVGLENLPKILKRAMDVLDDHINLQEKKLHALNMYIDRFKTEHDKAMDNIQNYLENPIKAFTLIKQLTSDLNNLKVIIKTRTESKTRMYDSLKYPLQEDLIGAAKAIARLQKTYKLSAKNLSKGNLTNAVYRPPLTAGDCYVLGQVLLNEEVDIANALPWMIESLRKYYTEENMYSFNEVNIIQYISKAYHILGDKKSALQWIQKLVDLHPYNLKAKKKVAYYEQSIAANEVKKLTVNGIKKQDKKVQKSNIEKDSEIYEALCRGDLTVPIKTSSRFSCHYVTAHHAFFKIAPIKMEVMYLDPDVILFYEMLSENEMDLIKEIARPRLHRSKAHDPETGNSHFVEERISEYTWILDTESDAIARISRRVMRITNLNMAAAEPLQVVNYGIGGHFEPHCDFPPLWFPVHKDMRYAKTGGDRIATIMFYMSDVANGGATVFPELGLSVTPVKGAAVYWPNLNGAGELDTATLHAGCPVLLGSKWVCNKWIHRYGQDVFQRCELGYQRENRKIPRPITKISRDRELFEEYKTPENPSRLKKHR